MSTNYTDVQAYILNYNLGGRSCFTVINVLVILYKGDQPVDSTFDMQHKYLNDSELRTEAYCECLLNGAEYNPSFNGIINYFKDHDILLVSPKLKKQMKKIGIEQFLDDWVESLPTDVPKPVYSLDEWDDEDVERITNPTKEEEWDD